MTALRIYKHFCLVLEAEKISSEKWQKMVKNWSKWSTLPDFDGLRMGGFFHPQRKLNLFWYHQYYSEYESGSQSKAQNLLPPNACNIQTLLYRLKFTVPEKKPFS